MTYPFSKIPIVFAALFVVFAWPASTSAATLSFSAPATVSVGEEFPLVVYASSTDRGFNAGEATLSFPKGVLEVVSIDTAVSSTIFNFWLTLPSFSNENGVVFFSGGTTHGILGSDIPILTVRMRAVGSGDALITASDASINASDGNGTNILEGITARRITVTKATISVPPKPAPSPQLKVETAATAPKGAPKESAVCGELFVNCDIHFPTIESVSVVPQQQGEFNIFVSGSASEGTHVHLRLRRIEVLYKEIQAIIKPDGTWEGVFTGIYTYGTYTIDATVEITDSHRTSQPVMWTDIHIFPPYSFFLFGMVFRWYVLVDMALGLLVLASGMFLLYCCTGTHEQRHPRRLAVYTFVAALIAFIVMAITASFLWKAEYSSKTVLWKNTDIPCIHREHSFSDQYHSALLKIFIDGKLQTIPAETGISPQCIAQVHTHDVTGALHFEFAERPVTLADFFAVAGITLTRAGYRLSVTVNGKDSTGGIETYAIQNGDSIVVKYITMR
jgi:hypothetical protein